MKPFVFALLGAFFWGVAPIFSKFGLVQLDPSVALLIRSLVVSLIMLVWAVVSGNLSSLAGIKAVSWGFIAAEAIFASLLGQLAYYYALKLGEASRIAPVVASYPLLTVFLAVLILGEKLTWTKMGGAFLILAGIILLKK